MIDSGTATPGMRVAERFRRNRKMTMTTRQTVSTSVNSTSPMEPRMDREASNAISRSTDGRNLLAEHRQQLLDVVDHLDRIGARLPLYRENHAAHAVEPGDGLVVFDAVDHVAELLEPNRQSIAISDDQRPVSGGVRQLSARLNRERLLLPVQPAGRQIDVALLNRALHFVDADVPRHQRVRIQLHAHGVFLRADTPATCETPLAMEMRWASSVSAYSSTV